MTAGAQRIVSCDDHMDVNALPPDLWTSRLPERLRAAGPRVQETSNGRFWFLGDAPVWRSGGVSALLPSAIVRAGIEDDGYRPSNPRLRLADMDRDGVEGSVIYGPITGLTPAAMRDVELRHACHRAYNDWAAEFNATDLGRLCMLALLPADDPGAAAAEVERVAARGHRGVQLGHFETSTPIHDPGWEPLWAACAETGLPLSFHLIGGTYLVHIKPGSWEMAAFAAVAPMQLDEVLATITTCGILERHPRLRVVLGESGIGWVPYVLERLETELDKYAGRMRDYRPALRPTELFRRQVFVTFEEDRVGVDLIPHIGADNVMWASDYPHPDSTFPRSREAVEETFRNVAPEITRKVVAENCARLYGLGARGIGG
ncbi:MAG TPA: amidohydrolase family protein [Candidatus Binatia bacterium]|nr:amidohydrolase family protein [Candidatus Binatia bacterium]